MTPPSPAPTPTGSRSTIPNDASPLPPSESWASWPFPDPHGRDGEAVLLWPGGPSTRSGQGGRSSGSSESGCSAVDVALGVGSGLRPGVALGRTVALGRGVALDTGVVGRGVALDPGVELGRVVGGAVGRVVGGFVAGGFVVGRLVAGAWLTAGRLDGLGDELGVGLPEPGVGLPELVGPPEPAGPDGEGEGRTAVVVPDGLGLVPGGWLPDGPDDWLGPGLEDGPKAPVVGSVDAPFAPPTPMPPRGPRFVRATATATRHRFRIPRATARRARWDGVTAMRALPVRARIERVRRARATPASYQPSTGRTARGPAREPPGDAPSGASARDA